MIHEFLYIPECPVPLLGRDLLSKLGAPIGTLCVEISKTVIKLTKGWSAFYYHHVPTILNTASDKVLLPEKVFCWPKFETTTTVTS